MAKRKDYSGINTVGGLTVLGTATTPALNYVLAATGSGGICDWQPIANVTGAWVADTNGFHSPAGSIGIGANSEAGVGLNITSTVSSVSTVSALVQIDGQVTMPASGNGYALSFKPQAVFTSSTTTANYVGVVINGVGRSAVVTSVIVPSATQLSIVGQAAITGVTITAATGLSLGTPTGGGTTNTGLFIGGGAGNGAGTVSEIIQLGSSQTGDLTQWQTSGGTVLASVGAAGTIGQGIGAAVNVGLYQSGTLSPASISTLYAYAQNTVLKPTAAGGNLYFSLIGVTGFNIDTTAAGGTVGAAYGLYISSLSKFGGSTLTGAYGLVVKQPAAGVSNYTAIFDPIVGIGITPTASLHVTTAATGTIAFNAVGIASATVDLATFDASATTAAQVIHIDKNGHLAGSQSAIPTIATGAGAGTGGALSGAIAANSSDQSGLIQVITGSSGMTANATICTVTFKNVYTTQPKSVLITPCIAASQALAANQQPAVYYTGVSASSFALTSGAAALATGTTYQWWYFVF